jgi:A/G-specific adenine glycosylase
MVFGRAEPLVDGNVQRVLARRFGLEEDPARGPGRRRTWATARRLVEQAEDPGAFNEGLMELGARVCTPRAPRCAECPIASGCAARAAGRQEEIPAATPRAERPTVHHHAVVIERAGRLLLQQRPATGLWGAMWQVPTVEAASALSEAEIVAALAPRVTGLTRRGEFVHQTTHRRVAFHVYGGRTRARRGVWRARGELDDLPMSNAQRRVLEVAG